MCRAPPHSSSVIPGIPRKTETSFKIDAALAGLVCRSSNWMKWKFSLIGRQPLSLLTRCTTLPSIEIQVGLKKFEVQTYESSAVSLMPLTKDLPFARIPPSLRRRCEVPVG